MVHQNQSESRPYFPPQDESAPPAFAVSVLSGFVRQLEGLWADADSRDAESVEISREVEKWTNNNLGKSA
jgi:hypothetical protein